jgi:hypothetical protein
MTIPMKKTLIASVALFAVALMMTIPFTASALSTGTGTPPDTGTAPTAATTIAPRELPNPLGTASIPELLARVITIFTGVAGSIALLMFVYGGITWVSSGGSAERIETGKKAMVYAVIGLTIIFGSYAILRALFLALGARL